MRLAGSGEWSGRTKHESGKRLRVRKHKRHESGKMNGARREKPTSQEKGRYGHVLKPPRFPLLEK